MIQLRPPADADNYRVQAGRFGDRFYTDPLPADGVWAATTDDDIYPAISTVKKASGQDWSRAMAKRLAKAPSQLVEIGNIDSEFERKARLNLLSDAGLDQASGRGTVVHAHAEAKLANRMPIYQVNEVVKPFIRTLDAFLAAYNPTLVAAEFVAVHRDLNAHGVRRGNQYLGFGGTGDAVLEIDGGLWLVDWKSRSEDSPHKAYPEEGAQVSAYGRAQYWIVGDDESLNGARRIAPLDLAGGLIVSIKPDSYECFPIDLDEGFDYWTDLHAWWQARRSETRPVGRKWAPRVPTPSASELVSPDEPAVVKAPTVAGNRARFKSLTDEQANHARDEFKRLGLNPNRTEFAERVSSVLDDAGRLGAPEPEPKVVADEDTPCPTIKDNRARFEGLTEIQKGKAREAFKRAGVNPNDATATRRVAHILNDIEERPSLRDMQERRAEQIANHTPVTVSPLDAEGGPATDEMVAEARLMFDMVLTPTGKEWTGFRVKEANAADVSFQMSKLSSVKRAHLYLTLCRWASWRQAVEIMCDPYDLLGTDEAEGNVEFSAILFMVDGIEPAHGMTLGHRLGSLSLEEAEKLATLVKEVVQSESGDNPVTETASQTTSQTIEK